MSETSLLHPALARGLLSTAILLGGGLSVRSAAAQDAGDDRDALPAGLLAALAGIVQRGRRRSRRRGPAR